MPRAAWDRQTDRRADRGIAYCSPTGGIITGRRVQYIAATPPAPASTNQNCPWIGLTHDLSWVGSVGLRFWWIGSAIAKVLKFEMIMLMQLKHD